MSWRSIILVGLTLAMAACGRRDSEAPVGGAMHQDVHRALEKLESGDIDQALVELGRLTPEGISPDNIPSWHARAVAELIERQRLATADSLLKLCGPVSRRPPEQRYLTAQLVMLGGNSQRALEIYDGIQGVPSLMAKVNFERAMIYSMRGDDALAAEASRRVLELHDHDAVARAMLVSSLIAMRQPMVALEEARHLPSDRPRWTLEAHAFLTMGDADSASVRLDRMLTEKSDATLQYLKGWALVEQREPEQGLVWLASLAEMGYKDAELHAARAMDQLGRSEEAQQVRDRFQARQRRAQVETLWAEGLSAIESDGPERAIRFLQDAVALDPENPTLLNDTGAVLTMLRRFEEAEARFDEALTVAPGNPTTYGHLVQLYELTGDTEKRERALRDLADAMANQ